jgi:hypothetical protein
MTLMSRTFGLRYLLSPLSVSYNAMIQEPSAIGRRKGRTVQPHVRNNTLQSSASCGRGFYR